MSTWTPPLQRMQYVIEQVLDAPASWRAQPDFADLDADTAREVLEQAGRFAVEVIAPINGSGDTEGCRWEASAVTTPTGYPAAWKAFVDGGWPALPCSPDWGGQGLPLLLDAGGAPQSKRRDGNTLRTETGRGLHDTGDRGAIRGRGRRRVVRFLCLARLRLRRLDAGGFHQLRGNADLFAFGELGIYIYSPAGCFLNMERKLLYIRYKKLYIHIFYMNSIKMCIKDTLV